MLKVDNNTILNVQCTISLSSNIDASTFAKWALRYAKIKKIK